MAEPIPASVRVAQQRFLLASVIGLMLVIPAAACDGGSARLFNSKASLACLKKRPEYQSFAGKPKAGHTFLILAGGRPSGQPFRGYLPEYGARGVSGYRFYVLFDDLTGVTVVFFDKLAQAPEMYRQYLTFVAHHSGQPPLTPEVRKSTRVIRNVFIDWGPTGRLPPKYVSAPILGCLQAR